MPSEVPTWKPIPEQDFELIETGVHVLDHPVVTLCQLLLRNGLILRVHYHHRRLRLSGEGPGSRFGFPPIYWLLCLFKVLRHD